MGEQGGRRVGAAGMDPMLSPDSIDKSAPESTALQWLDAMRDGAAMPPEHDAHGFKEALILRHLTVNRVEPGLVVSTLTVKPPITNRYRTLHGGAVATVASIVGMAAVKTLGGDKNYFMTEMGISYVYGARIEVDLEIEAKVLRFGKSVAVSSIDIRNKETKQSTFQGRCTYYSMPTSRI